MRDLFRLRMPGLFGMMLGATVLHAAAQGPVESLEGELIDKVWSGHPVSYDILAERGYLFIAYYDAERRLTVLSRREDDKEWIRVQPEGFFIPGRNRMSNVTGWDTHNYLTMALDRDGHLHLSGNMHVDPLIYYRTRNPFDINTLECIEKMTGQHEDRTTYPRFLRNAEGELVFRYRYGGSGNGNDFYNIYDPKERAWKPLLQTPLLDGEGQCSAYGTGPIKGPDGRFHMLWMWRDTPNAGSNHTLTYARSRDLIHWETSSGKPCPLPMRPGDGEVIDPVPPFGGLINMSYRLSFDANQSPVVAYHKYDAAGKSQIHVARIADNGKWLIRQVSAWDFRWEFSMTGSLDPEVSVHFSHPNPDGSLNLYCTTKAGSGRWCLDAATLELLKLPPLPAQEKAAKPVYPHLDYPGMQMNEVSSSGDAMNWVLRWETLGRNQDQPRDEVPPLSELRLYALPR